MSRHDSELQSDAVAPGRATAASDHPAADDVATPLDAAAGSLSDFDQPVPGEDAAGTDADARGTWRGLRQGDGLVSAVRLLAELTLDPLLPLTLQRRLQAGEPLVLVVTVPGPAWVAPVAEVLAAAGHQRARCITQQTRPKPTAGRDPDREASELLAEGRPVVAVTPDKDYLAPVLAAAADRTLDVTPLNARLVARAVALWCGSRSRRPVAAEDLAGLDLLDVAAALRAGATPAECRARLRRASRSRVGLPSSESVPPLATLTGYGAAQAWATQLVADIGRVRRGEMKAALLEGAVFYGPPGTGKTTLAKAIAREAGVPCYETSVAAWFATSSGHLDGVIKAAAQFFDALALAAKAHGTAVGYADEWDALPNRARLSDRGADWWLPVITFCLIRVEALRRDGVVLLAATNDITRIDAALLRPGRFDRQFEILPPDEADRRAILRTHLGGDLPDADLTPAARLTPGATGAVLAGAVRAARRQAQAERRPLVLADLLAALVPPDPRTAASLRAAALHEAGHALVAYRLGLTVIEVTIQAGPGHGGATRLRFADPTPDRLALERHVIGLLAGRAADVVLGQGATAGASADLQEATRILAALHASFGLGDCLSARIEPERASALLREDGALAAQVEADLQRLQQVAAAQVAADRAAVLALVTTLLDKRVVSGAEVAALAAAHRPRVRVRVGTAGSRPVVPPRAPSPGGTRAPAPSPVAKHR